MTFCGEQLDSNYYRYVGWPQTANGAGYKFLFSAENVQYISRQVAQTLAKFGLDVRVSPRVIGGVLSNLFENSNPKIGDIYTRYIIPQEEPRNDVASITNQAITVLVNNILVEKQQIACNSQLNIWSTVLGDFNPQGLRSYAPLKTKQNDYIKGVFIENY